MEIVHLDGSRNSLTAEEFDRFIESFRCRRRKPIRMNTQLKRRLQRLEDGVARQFAAAPCPSPAPQIAAWLDSIGVLREPNESLAETTARAMGISTQELRAELEQKAFGGPR
jgi:hypothetical protein